MKENKEVEIYKLVNSSDSITYLCIIVVMAVAIVAMVK